MSNDYSVINPPPSSWGAHAAAYIKAALTEADPDPVLFAMCTPHDFAMDAPHDELQLIGGERPRILVGLWGETVRFTFPLEPHQLMDLASACLQALRAGGGPPPAQDSVVAP